jgi:hypothetical protein
VASYRWLFLKDTRGAHPSPAGHTQLSRIYPDCRGPEAKPHQSRTPDTDGWLHDGLS